jgi:anti-sigma regulatory factor (Ser/Thr protein kinase)
VPTVELRFTPLPAHVRTARLVAASVSRRSGVDEALVDEIKLAVGEACARAVALHSTHAPTEEVVVSLSDDDAAFTISVSDVGPAGDHDEPDLAAFAADEWDVGADLPAGFQLTVIRGIVDDVDVSATGAGTVVRMRWPLGSGAPSS